MHKDYSVPDRLLYHTPGSCSRVALIALEELGQPYDEKCVVLLSGEQYSPKYLKINPKGKVPVLVDHGRVVTELPAILHHLAGAHPESGLLPLGDDGRPTLDSLSDLIWIAGTLHPTAARIFRPGGVSTADPDGVKAIAITQMTGHAAMISARLANRRWWYGEGWSITDSFLAWVFDLVTPYGFPLADFPVIAALRDDAKASPSFVRARERERAIAARDGLAMPPGFSL